LRQAGTCDALPLATHSIAFWDNRCVQHRAIFDYWPNTRSGFRVQLDGQTAPVAG
jgi:taurine dioxygenase